MQVVDQLAAKIAPAMLETERGEIEGKLAVLEAEREERRVAAFRLFYAPDDGAGTIHERKIAEHHAQIAKIDTEARALRARRRQIANLLRPEPVPKQTLVNVPMSPELVRVIDDLENARAKRARLIADRPAELSERDQAKRAGKIGEIEASIRDLRIKRAELLRPYNAQVSRALAPLIRSAATRLDEAAQNFLDAMAELREIAVVLPADVPGLGNGLEGSALIDSRGVYKARSMAADLLAATPSEAIQ